MRIVQILCLLEQQSAISPGVRDPTQDSHELRCGQTGFGSSLTRYADTSKMLKLFIETSPQTVH